jgi:hypothetical protein
MFSVPVERTGTDTCEEDRQVAVDLSRHCAYLVAFLPQLLPDHSLHTKLVLQQVLQEAKDSLAAPVASEDEEVGQTSSSAPLLEDRRKTAAGANEDVYGSEKGEDSRFTAAVTAARGRE